MNYLLVGILSFVFIHDSNNKNALDYIAYIQWQNVTFLNRCFYDSEILV